MSMVLALAFSAGSATGDVYIYAEAALEGKNTYTVTLYQSADDAPATSLVLFLLLNNDTAVLQPMTSSENDSSQYAQLSSEQQESGFLMSENFHGAIDNMENRYCLAIAVYKTNGTGGLQAGALLSCKLRLLSDETPVTLEAASAETPITLNGILCFSSASTLDEKPLSVFFESLTMSQDCDPPAPPEQVKASRRYRNKIVITWERSQPGDNFEYKVYRSLSDNIAESIPLNTAYISDLTWTDNFPADETNTQSSGCSCALQYYYYWVRAKDALTGCISDFSHPPARGALIAR